MIWPKRNKGGGYRDPDLDLWTRAWLEGMQSMLHSYTNPDSSTYLHWGASAIQTAIGMGRGHHCTRCLLELCRDYLDNRRVLPINPYGDWNESYLHDENLSNEISIYLLSTWTQYHSQKADGIPPPAIHQTKIRNREEPQHLDRLSIPQISWVQVQSHTEGPICRWP